MMKTFSGQTRRRALVSGRALGSLAATALLATVVASGCSSSDGNALDEYTGTWNIDPDPAKSMFTLTCPFLADPIPLPLWSQVRMEEGTLSDLVELGGTCPGYYDVTSKGTATLSSPDPFTSMAPICQVFIDEASTQYIEFRFTNWKITLQAPVKGQAPHGQMIGTAGAPIFILDADGVPQPDERGECSYVVHADLTKIAKD